MVFTRLGLSVHRQVEGANGDSFSQREIEFKKRRQFELPARAVGMRVRGTAGSFASR
jgi:hypothetical protein